MIEGGSSDEQPVPEGRNIKNTMVGQKALSLWQQVSWTVPNFFFLASTRSGYGLRFLVLKGVFGYGFDGFMFRAMSALVAVYGFCV